MDRAGPRLSAVSGDGGFGHQDRERQIERLVVDPESHEMLRPKIPVGAGVDGDEVGDVAGVVEHEVGGAASCPTTCVVQKFRSAGRHPLHFLSSLFCCQGIFHVPRAHWRAARHDRLFARNR